MTVTSNEEREIIRTLLDNCSAGTTDMVPDVGYAPVTNYTDPERLTQEINVLFRRFPIVVGHVEQLAEPGCFITHNTTGVPILVTRDRKGELKAFMNVCRHRGMRVVNEPCGKAAMFTCPYHSWNYDLDGRLRGMPQPDCFESIDRESLGLVPLPVGERFGLIWVRASAGDEVFDLDAWLAPMSEQLSSLRLENHTIFRSWSGSGRGSSGCPVASSWERCCSCSHSAGLVAGPGWSLPDFWSRMRSLTKATRVVRS